MTDHKRCECKTLRGPRCKQKVEYYIYTPDGQRGVCGKHWRTSDSSTLQSMGLADRPTRRTEQ